MSDRQSIQCSSASTLGRKQTFLSLLIAKGRYQTTFAKNKVQTCSTSYRMGDHVTHISADLGIPTKKTVKRQVLEIYFRRATRPGWAAIGTVL